MVHLVFGAILLLIPIIGVLHDSNKKASEYLLQVLVITSVCLLSFNLLLVLTAQNVSTRVGSVAMYGKDKVLMHLIRELQKARSYSFIHIVRAIIFFRDQQSHSL